MQPRFSFLVAARILSGVRHRYLSVVSRIAVTGVALGVAMLVVVFSISDGFGRAFTSKILGLYPHMVVLQRGSDFPGYRRAMARLRKLPGVVEVVPATYDEPMMVHRDRRAEVVLKGMPLTEPSLQARLAAVMEPREGENRRAGSLAEAEARIAALAPRFSATTRDDLVEISGGTWGSTAQILVWDAAAEGAPPWVRSDEPLWAQPSITYDRIRMAAPRGLLLRCARGRTEHRLRVPEGGGFSGFDELGEGRFRCTAAPPGSKAEPERWDLHVAGGKVRTLVLDRDGWPLDDLDLEEPDLPEEVASRVRVIWPGHAAFRVRLPDGSLHRVEGPASGWLPVKDLPLPGVLLGSTLARKLRVSVGDHVQVITPLRGLGGDGMGPAGMAPSAGSFRVGGVLHGGFHEFDSRFAMADLRSVQRFFNRGDVVRWVEVRIDDVDATAEMAHRVSQRLDAFGMPDLLDRLAGAYRRLDRAAGGEVDQLPDGAPDGAADLLVRNATLYNLMQPTLRRMVPDSSYRVIDWRRMNRNLLGAIRLQRIVLTIFFMIIIVVAASNVVGNQVMLIHEKTRQIAILRAMGTTRGQIQRIFRLQGLITAGAGAAIGSVLGVLLCWLLRAFPISLDAEIYFIENLPVRPSMTAIVIVAASTLVGTWLATHYSARRAASLDPIQGLHRVD